MTETLEKLTERMGKMLMRADNEGATEEERDTALKMAQQLASATGISFEVARRQQLAKHERETPQIVRVEIGERGAQNLAAYVELFHAIAVNNDLQWEYQGSMSAVSALGFPSDVRMAETLYAYLAPQMAAAAVAWLRDEEKQWRSEGVTRNQALRSYYQKFADRIRTRLYEARVEEERRQAAYTHEIDGRQVSTALVLVDKRKELTRFYRENRRVRARFQGRSRIHSRSAGRAGDRAGRDAKLKPDTELGGGKRAIEGGGG